MNSQRPTLLHGPQGPTVVTDAGDPTQVPTMGKPAATTAALRSPTSLLRIALFVPAGAGLQTHMSTPTGTVLIMYNSDPAFPPLCSLIPWPVMPQCVSFNTLFQFPSSQPFRLFSALKLIGIANANLDCPLILLITSGATFFKNSFSNNSCFLGFILPPI